MMFSFLWPWALHSSQPPPLEDDPTGSDHHDYLSDPKLYQGPIDVTPTEMPDLYDILLTDIDEGVLQHDVSTALGSAYLSETPCLTSPHTTVNGITFGKHRRALFPLVVRRPRQSHSYVIHFLYDSGIPHTYLSKEACDTLYGTNPAPVEFVIEINGSKHNVNPPNAGSNFEHVNLLGTDFCAVAGIVVTIDYVKKTATMHFGQWE